MTPHNRNSVEEERHFDLVDLLTLIGLLLIAALDAGLILLLREVMRAQ